MQNNLPFIRALLGFLVAPAIPALVLWLLNLGALHGGGTLVFLLLAPFAYCAAIVLGIPAYILMRRWRAQGLLVYVMVGAIVSALFAIAIQGIDIISNLFSAPEHGMALLNNSMRMALIGAVYGGTASFVFWVIAIWRGRCQ